MPEAKMPDTKMPDTKMPDTKMLDTKMPGTKFISFMLVDAPLRLCVSKQKQQQTRVFGGSSNRSTESNTEWRQPTRWVSMEIGRASCRERV